MSITVNISTIQDFYDFVLYGAGHDLDTANYGTSNNFLEVYLQNDIDWSDYGTPGERSLFPSGSPHAWYFNFHGNNYKIKNLYHISSGTFYLFYGNVVGSHQKFYDVIFEDVYINAVDIYFIGRLSFGLLSNVHITGYLQGSDTVCGFGTCDSIQTGNWLRAYNSSFNGKMVGFNIYCTWDVSSYDFGQAYSCTIMGYMQAIRDIRIWSTTAINCCCKATLICRYLYGTIGGASNAQGAGYSYIVIQTGSNFTSLSNQKQAGPILAVNNSGTGSISNHFTVCTDADIKDVSYLRSVGFAI